MKTKLLAFVLAALMLVGCTGIKHHTSNSSYRQISMEEAISLMEKETDYLILDVRRADEFAEGHIPNAVNLPNENIGADEIPELSQKDRMILVYCRSGRRSKEAAQKLADLGYTNIIEFGGILDYTGELEK